MERSSGGGTARSHAHAEPSGAEGKEQGGCLSDCALLSRVCVSWGRQSAHTHNHPHQRATATPHTAPGDMRFQKKTLAPRGPRARAKGSKSKSKRKPKQDSAPQENVWGAVSSRGASGSVDR